VGNNLIFADTLISGGIALFGTIKIEHRRSGFVSDAALILPEVVQANTRNVIDDGLVHLPDGF